MRRELQDTKTHTRSGGNINVLENIDNFVCQKVALRNLVHQLDAFLVATSLDQYMTLHRLALLAVLQLQLTQYNYLVVRAFRVFLKLLVDFSEGLFVATGIDSCPEILVTHVGGLNAVQGTRKKRECSTVRQINAQA